MDGTLVDSEKLWGTALEDLAIRAGGQLSTRARLAMVGTSMPVSMAIFREDMGQPDRPYRSDVAWLTDRVAELFADGLDWRPGARELLHEVRAAGVPTALVTSTERRLAEVALKTLGAENFDVLICGDEVARPKPDPEPYLTAAGLLGVPIGACVAIEDSPSGVASAVAAGATVLAVPSDVTLPSTDGIHLRSSLSGVDLEFLAALR
ncbi:haloacid dehalogenase [Actinoplanes ianthinogenes]|uniref:Haloacid dehalogenase n=2 Tax=Actinoplanes ianthinogenes TaxID=122358 RepID=A0ABM7LM96_9ACTN|nr:haloacid dehalogenase [Actinoplanes ianthinogenes]GGR11750.1 haloacid dehalogenase [Actinoplanes ianthinogenes]